MHFYGFQESPGLVAFACRFEKARHRAAIEFRSAQEARKAEQLNGILFKDRKLEFRSFDRKPNSFSFIK